VSWARFDDRISDHPKIWRAGPMGELAHYRALIWSNRQNTDGELPAAVLKSLCRGFEDQASQVAETLVRVRLWERADDGWRIHDFGTCGLNTPRDEVLRKRELRAAAGRLGAAARWHPDGRPNGKTNTPDSKPDATRMAGS
jgi:hypothetical protein